MNVRTASGHMVRSLPLGGGLFEFVTRGEDGQVISTARLGGSKARQVLAGLGVAA
ncbi:hypothetical protein [Streptomyces galilaeus]|uniref:hypothetical protein n=1 Tax=Streptomyces galilaeus TaxID=33899 RepID=UPI0038F7B93C